MRQTLWRLTLKTSPEAEEAVSELLAGLFSCPVSSFTNVETGMTSVAQFFEHPKAASKEQRALIHAGLRHIQACGLKIGPARISFTRVPRQDWAESWKKHFHPLRIGAKLLVRPSWSRRKAGKGWVEVVLDPGLSFGTGQHPTTAFCLEQLVARRSGVQAQSLLDVGTGSGILAIAAAKLGYQPVVGFDFDAEAVRVAKENARSNGVGNKVRLHQRDLTKRSPAAGKKYSVVCANLLADLLLEERQKLLALVQPTGLLILAGILKTEFAAVREAYERAGMEMVTSRAAKEWRSGAFRRAASK